MASKKYTSILGFVALMLSFATTQSQDVSYDWRDSSLIPSKRMPQHSEFLNNQYYYPAHPRNQWELGLKVGAFTIAGDVPSRFPTLGFGAHIRKALGYTFSLRLEYMHGEGKGIHWQPALNYRHNPAWVNNGYVPTIMETNGDITPAVDQVYYNYETKANDLSLQGVFTLNNIRFHKAKTGVLFYVFAGLGITWYESFVNALDENNARYNFNAIAPGTFDTKSDKISELKDLMDDTFETPAESYANTRMKLFGQTARGTAHIGGGIAFKLSKRLNLALEDRITFTTDDLLDGQQWSEQAAGAPVTSRNFDAYNYATIGLNINLGSKAVEPLWWLNPLEFAYSELNAPKHMKMPKPILDDADGDGITDQFDNEPNTPAGSPVDSHGVSRDTDGDGVPDYKDKQLVTPTECQPVDADGVGKCPDPPCCDSIMQNMMKKPVCGIGDLPSISFSGKSVKVSKDAEAVLATVADKMKNNPDCKVVVTGYGEPSKASQQLSWDRVNSVINYMVDKQGISMDRFIFKYGEGGGDPNTVDLRPATEGDEGPNTVPAPHPNLRRNK